VKSLAGRVSQRESDTVLLLLHRTAGPEGNPAKAKMVEDFPDNQLPYRPRGVAAGTGDLFVFLQVVPGVECQTERREI
jgi:hypothetical protein